jgi:hypothetical protein
LQLSCTTVQTARRNQRPAAKGNHPVTKASAQLPKLSPTPAQQQALRRVVNSFSKFEDLIIQAMAGRGDLRMAVWLIYCCSLAAEITTGKVELRSLQMRKSTLARLADYAGPPITVSTLMRRTASRYGFLCFINSRLRDHATPFSSG